MGNSNVSTAGIVLVLLAVAPWWSPPVEAQGPQQASHPIILIDGDADLCDQRDTVNGVDEPDGIVNCATADGSAAHPYIIRGWSIANNPAATCRLGGDPSLCASAPSCSMTRVPAAVSICGTRKHIIVEYVSILNEEIGRQVNPPDNQLRMVDPAAAGLTVSNVDNLVVRNTTILAAGVGIYLSQGKSIPGLRAAERPLTLEDVRIAGLPETPANVPTPTGGGATPSAGLSLLEAHDVNLTLRNVVIDGTARNVALRMSATAPAYSSLQADDLDVSNATVTGIELNRVNARLDRARFSRVGTVGVAAGPATTNGVDVALTSGDFQIRNSRFEVQAADRAYTVGVQVRSDARGVLERNAFTGSQGGVAIEQSTGCNTLRARYNDMPLLRVLNDASCPFNAIHNWWGDPAGPGANADPGVLWDPPLSAPVETLPRVRVGAPAFDAPVFGRSLLQGTLENPNARPPQRVEATLRDDDWNDNLTADGTDPWVIPLDTAGQSLGPLPVWLRACYAGPDCGPPTGFRVYVIERPLPPIALLDARPRVAKTGQPITLDASLSYSPQGSPIAAYRFDLGDGTPPDWTEQSRRTVVYGEAGQYAVSVAVLDARGLHSDNVPQVLLRIAGPVEPGSAGNATPAPAWWLVAATALAVGAWRRNP